jgi:hypothetical protein
MYFHMKNTLKKQYLNMTTSDEKLVVQLKIFSNLTFFKSNYGVLYYPYTNLKQLFKYISILSSIDF